jgi:hypothetical protein
MPIRREPAWSDLPLESILSSFEAGHSIQDISDETGLPVLEVFRREKDLPRRTKRLRGQRPHPPDLPRNRPIPGVAAQ